MSFQGWWKYVDLTQKFGITGKELRNRGLSLLAPCIEKLNTYCCERDLVLKRQAVSALGKIGDAASLDFMVSLLTEDADTVKEAASAIALIEDENVVSKLLMAIHNSPPALQSVLIPALASFPSPEVIFYLSRILTEPGTPLVVKLTAARVMGEIGDVGLSPALLDSLPGAPVDLQVAVLKSLASTGYESKTEAYDILRKVFTGEAGDRPKVRSALISALKPMDGDSHLELIKMGLKDSNPRVVANSVAVLGQMEVNPRKIINLLQPMLADVSNSRIRANIAIALSPHDPATGASVLSGLLNSSDKHDRASAAYAARFVKNDSMALWLTTLLSSEDDSDVIANIHQSLAFFEDHEIFDALVKFLGNTNPLIRSAAAQSLGRIGNNDSCESIVNALKVEEDSSVLCEMITALGKLGDPSLVAKLADYLQHTDLRVQANCVEALNAIGTVEIVPFIEPFLNSSDNRVKANAAVALWSMGSLDVLKSLCEMLSHLNLKQRSSAAYAIGEIGITLRQLQKEPNKYYFLISALKEEPYDRVPPQANNSRQVSVPPQANNSRQVSVPPQANNSRLVNDPDLASSGFKNAEFQSADLSAVGGSEQMPHFLDLSSGSTRSGSSTIEPQSGYPMEEAEKYFSLLNSKQTNEAKAWLDTCIEVDPANIFLKYLKADFFRMSQKILSASEAFDDFDKASIEADEPFLNAYVHLANICSTAHEQGQSIRAYFGALKVQLKTINAEVDMGIELLDSGDVIEASLLLKNIVARIPLNGKLHYVAGRNFLKGRHNEEAFKNLFRAYLLAPDSGEVLLGFAFSCYKTKRYKFVRIIAKKLTVLLGETSPVTMKVLDLVSALDKAGL
jgi:HEAT repeat protein